MASSVQVASAGNGNQEQRSIKLSPSEGWVTVILAAVLILITISAIQDFQWTPNLGILTPTTIFGCVLGFALAKQRVVPQVIADIPALFLGLLFAFYETAQADVGGNIGSLFSRLGTWIQAALSGQGSTDDAIFLLFLAVLTMLLGYVTMWLIFRSRTPWLAVLANAVVLLINLNYETDDKVIFAIIFMLVALLLLVRFNLVEHIRVWKSKGLRYSPEIGWDFMQLGVIFAIVVMLLSVTLPSGLTSAALANLWNDPSGPWASIQSKFNQIFSISSGGKANQVAFGDTLTIQPNVNLPTLTIMSYFTTDTSNSYMTIDAVDQFDGSIHWKESNGLQTHKVSTTEEITPESSYTATVQQSIQLVNAPIGPYVYALGEPASFSFPIIAHSDGIPLNSKDSTGSYADWQAEPGTIHNNMRYSALSYVSTATPDQLRKVAAPPADGSSNDLYSQAFLARYLQLPTDLQEPNDLSRTTAQQIVANANATNMYDKAMALVDYFHSNFQYSTNPGDPLAEQNVVDTLLTKKVGYCTWFASGFTVMARELGMPARLIQGFAPGTADPAHPGYRIIKGTDAHAWAQIYFPGYGWINFEPSASFTGPTLPTKSSVPSTTNTPDNQRQPVTQKPQPTPAPGSTTTSKTQTPAATTVNPVVADVGVSLSLIIAVMLLAVLAALAWWRLIFRGLTPIGQAFARMAFLGRLAGARPLRSQTATEYGAALAERLPGQRPAIEEVTQLYVLERWAPAAPEITPTFGERWQRLRGALLRAILRRKKRPTLT